MKISAVIPAYNAESTIAETLDSILAQTCPMHEIIVVDDVSPDGTVSAIKKWHADHPDAPLILIEQSVNTGPAGARNSGIEAASGEWVAFLDSDDAWLPEKTAIQIGVVEENLETALVCGRTVPLTEKILKAENGKQKSDKGEPAEAASLEARRPRRASLLRHDGVPPPEEARSKTNPDPQSTVYSLQSNVCSLSLSDFIYHNPIATSTVMVKRDAVLGVGGFDTQFCGPEDYDLWMRIVATCKCVELDVPLTRYRTTVGSLSMDDRKFLPEVLRVLEKAFGPDGALADHPQWRRRAYAEQYSSASWMAYNRGANGVALRYLFRSWLYDVRRLHKERTDPFLRLKILYRYLFRVKPDVDMGVPS